MVGTGRFELPTPRTPSECSTRLSHVPTGGTRRDRRVGFTGKFYTRAADKGSGQGLWLVILSAVIALRSGAITESKDPCQRALYQSPWGICTMLSEEIELLDRADEGGYCQINLSSRGDSQYDRRESLPSEPK